MQMKVEFDINLNEKDLYQFSMYHNYTSFQGILSIFVGIAAFVAAVITREQVDPMYTVLYIFFGIAILLYMPITLRMSTRHQMAKSEQLKQTLHYRIDEEGITVMQREQTAVLPWNQVYRLKETKGNILIYSTRINAFIFPKEQLKSEAYESLKEIAKNNLEKYRYNIRKGK